ncbi:MAG: DNA mismatch repair protein MutS, partial [Verrucomicrobia bacterium]
MISSEQKEQIGEFDHALEYDSYAFLPEQAVFTLCEHFKVKSLDGFGCTQMPQAVAAAGAIVHYLKHQLRRKIDHLTSLRSDAPADYV